MSHEAGIQPLTDDVEIAAVPELHGDIVEQRRQLTGWLLQQQPIAPVGTAYAYSNAGFVIVAAMMEALTGESWETLMRERIFRPLGMSTAGFGWPGENAPDKNFLWGHQADGERVLPVDPDGEYQLPQVLAPAGDVHASLADMARYAAAYLRAWCGDMSILEGDTVRAMYRQRIKSGIGWGVQAAFGFDSVAVYSGSADTFFFLIAVIPEAGRAFVVGSNAADPQAQKATVALLKRIVAEHSGDSD